MTWKAPQMVTITAFVLGVMAEDICSTEGASVSQDKSTNTGIAFCIKTQEP